MHNYAKITKPCSNFPVGIYVVITESTYYQPVRVEMKDGQSVRIDQVPGLLVANAVHQLVIPTSAASKLADSIEELCDEFVATYDNEGFQPIFRAHSTEELFSEILKCGNKLEDFNIYAAIWTPTGLQYVAKLEISTNDFQLI